MATGSMPVVFTGHGSPLLAVSDDAVTQGLAATGEAIRERHGNPKAILAISAHWYVAGTFIQSAAHPRQVYDMYGFPDELYQLRYPVTGYAPLTRRVQEIFGNLVKVDDSWGIDHGTWTPLVHMFPDSDVPVVQLSCDGRLSLTQAMVIGKALSCLRDEGYLIFGSGNVAHNLALAEWDNPGGTEATLRFNRAVRDAVLSGDYGRACDATAFPDWSYAVPTPDHFLPLAYCLGAAGESEPAVFNDVCNLGTMAMTGFTFGL